MNGQLHWGESKGISGARQHIVMSLQRIAGTAYARGSVQGSLPNRQGWHINTFTGELTLVPQSAYVTFSPYHNPPHTTGVDGGQSMWRRRFHTQHSALGEPLAEARRVGRGSESLVILKNILQSQKFSYENSWGLLCAFELCYEMALENSLRFGGERER